MFIVLLQQFRQRDSPILKMAEFENKGFEPEENKEETRNVESEQHQIGIPNGNSLR